MALRLFTTFIITLHFLQAPTLAQVSQTSPYPWSVIAVDSDHTLYRISPEIGGRDRFTWVIIHNGEEVLQRAAGNENQFKYPDDKPGAYTAYLTSWAEGTYRPASNFVSYVVEEKAEAAPARDEKSKREPKRKGQKKRRDREPELPCKLYLDASGTLNRSLIEDELIADLIWWVRVDGRTVLKRNAKGATQFRYRGGWPGNYEIVVLRGLTPISNTITYTNGPSKTPPRIPPHRSSDR